MRLDLSLYEFRWCLTRAHALNFLLFLGDDLEYKEDGKKPQFSKKYHCR